MNLQQVLENTDEAVIAKTGRGLSEPEKTILEGVWKGMTYEDIAEKSKFSLNYLKRHVGPQLWERLSIAMGEPIKKTNWRKVVLERQGEDAGFEESVFANPKFHEEAALIQPIEPRQDFNDAPDDSVFYGRNEELEKLGQLVIEDKCRVVTLLGIGGMGKSALAVKLARELQDDFQFVIWRSLRPGKSLSDLLGSIISFFAPGYRSQPKISQVIEYLRRYRCLLVLDGLEAILQSGQLVGCYREDYKDYAEFLRQLGESSHQSCVLIAALEAPREVTHGSGATSPVRLFKLKGLNNSIATKILEDQLEQDSKNSWQDLINLYLGNPAALKIVAQIVAELFNGNVAEFLQQETLMFEDISRLIAPSFERISDLEKELLYWLATEQEAVSFSTIGSTIPLTISQGELLEALKSLEARSLIETTTAEGKSLFTLQSLLKEYVITDLLGKIGNSPAKGELPLSQLLRQEELIELTPSQKKPLNLSQWFQYKFDGNWQPIEVFFRAEPNMLGNRLRSTFNLRSSNYIKRFKEIKLADTAGDTPMAMLVAIAKEGTQEVLIRVQVQSVEEDTKLPSQLALSLFNNTGEIIWQKKSNLSVEFIQLPVFKAKLKERFRIEITLNQVTCIEEFIV